MPLKHLLLITGLVAATSTAVLAQQATGTQGHSGTTGAMRSQQAPSTGVTSPSPGAPSNSGFGSSAAGGSGGTSTGPTSPGSSGAVSGMGNTRPQGSVSGSAGRAFRYVRFCWVVPSKLHRSDQLELIQSPVSSDPAARGSLYFTHFPPDRPCSP